MKKETLNEDELLFTRRLSVFMKDYIKMNPPEFALKVLGLPPKHTAKVYAYINGKNMPRVDFIHILMKSFPTLNANYFFNVEEKSPFLKVNPYEFAKAKGEAVQAQEEVRQLRLQIAKMEEEQRYNNNGGIFRKVVASREMLRDKEVIVQIFNGLSNPILNNTFSLSA